MKALQVMAYYGTSVIKMLVHFKPLGRLLSIFLRASDSQEKVLHFRKEPLRFVVRGRMDVWSIKETFLDAFYTRYGVSIEDGWRVIDIGAGIGDFSVYAAYQKPGVTVYAYEPYPESYRLLVKNLGKNKIENVQPYNLAVWSGEGPLNLNISSGEPLKFESHRADHVQNDPDMLTVQAVSLESILNEHHLEKLDLLKLDCEGAEYDILMDAPPQILHRVDRIIMEWHDFAGVDDHHALAAYLRDLGYRVVEHENCVHDNIGYLFASRIW